MTREGFQLRPGEIADQIARDIPKPGAHLAYYADAYAHADYSTGMTIEYDPVDRVVVTFIGSREQAAAVVAAARKVCE